MSPISFTQQGIITQCELAKILIITSTLHLEHRFKAYQLSMFFSVPKDRLISHPNFWYVFGYFDMKAMAFANPVFIVPSAEVKVSRGASPLPPELAELDGLVLVGQRP